MKITLIEETNLGKVVLKKGDKIITNGHRLYCESLDLTEADPGAISTDGKKSRKKISFLEAQSFDPKDFDDSK